MTERLVVVGGDAAGMSAASQARRRRDPDDLEIVAFERGRYTSYAACGIPYFIGGVVAPIEALIARTPQAFRDDHAIDVRMRTEVTSIDLERRRVLAVSRDTGAEHEEPFDVLMIATGATPVRPDIPGIDAGGVFGVQTLDDGAAVRAWLEREGPGRAVVVGGGYVGLEMAEALVERGLEVHLVEREAAPMSTLDPDMGGMVADALRDVGVQVHLSETVEAIEADAEGRVSAVVTDEHTFPADMIVLGLGVRPNTGLAAAAGIAVGSAGGIAVDAQMRTSADGVFAAGDCVESFHRVSRRPVVVALGTHANKQGRVAGITIGGGTASFGGVVGTAVSKICAYEVGRTGLTEREARDAGLDAVAATIASTTRAGYYPGARSITVKIVAERGTGRLLGGQIVGREGAAKRIDVLATALWNEMSVDEVAGMDLSYAPPFSPVWDPVLIAARKAAERVEETA